ncbi:hypothetical protein ACFE04_021957 [Oxalis oulophora]
MAAEEDVNFSTSEPQLSELFELKACIEDSKQDSQTELEILGQRLKFAASLLTYLKSKARIMDIPHIASGQFDVVGLVDQNGTDEETLIGIFKQQGPLDEQGKAYICELLKSVQVVANVMENLVRRVLLAESEAALEKEKATLNQSELKKKTIQIEGMSLKLDEMEQFALGTNSVLNEMRQRVEDLVEETSRQRHRASENEQELSRVKQDFESLKSYVSSLISVRETLLSSEKQFQTIEKLFERLVVKTSKLEGEKSQKEAEVQKLMEENVRLTALLDKKDAQLLAMNEQCKFMALSASDF